MSSSGTDSGFCSQANPCATISRAVSLAIPNDTIYVGAGRFADHVVLPSSVDGVSINNLTIEGAGMGATTVSGGFNGSGSVFTVQSGEHVTIADMAITGGQAQFGGGIHSDGDLTLERDEVAFNSAMGSAGSGGSGGGVFAGSGALTVSDSAIELNQASELGGGVAAGSATLTRDLIAFNELTGSAAGPSVGGGVYGAGLSLTADTIVGNRVLDSAGNPAGFGGGVGLAPGATTLTSDTIANNTAALGSAVSGIPHAPALVAATYHADILVNSGPECANQQLALSLTLDPSGGCGFQGPTADPGLGPLTNNGGPTATMAITASSPAYDTNDQYCDGTDQRGVSYLQRGAGSCDIGAYQVSAPTTYVANPAAGSVTAYATDATGDAAPVLSLSGSSTGLSQPTGVVVDVNGRVYVANTANNSITEYAPEVTGNVAPIATIAGSRTGLNKPQDLAVDDAGRLFVTNLSNTVTRYGPDASGNVAPAARIAGRRTLLRQPHGIVIDPDGNLRVSNANGTVNSYAANASGNVAPRSRITRSGLTNAQGLNFDPAGQLLVADSGSGRVDTFAPDAAGETKPRSLLTGNPALRAPIGLDLDEPGDIFVADSSANSVAEYGPQSSGAATPLASIVGPETGLAAPAFLSELPPTPAPRLRVSTRKRLSRRQVLKAGIVLHVKAGGRLAFRGEPVLISARARVRRQTIAVAKAMPLRPGKATLRLIQTRRAAKSLRRDRRTTITVTITVRSGAGTQRHQVTINPQTRRRPHGHPRQH